MWSEWAIGTLPNNQHEGKKPNGYAHHFVPETWAFADDSPLSIAYGLKIQDTAIANKTTMWGMKSMVYFIQKTKPHDKSSM